MTYGQAVPAQDPGRTLGIVGLVCSVLCSIVGLVVSIIALNKSKAAGYNNQLAKAGIVVSIVMMVLGAIAGFTRSMGTA